MDNLTLALLASLGTNGILLALLYFANTANYPLKRISNLVLLIQRKPFVYVRCCSTMPTEPSKPLKPVNALGAVEDLAKEAIGAVGEALPKVSKDMAGIRNKSAIQTTEILASGFDLKDLDKALESLK